MNTESALKARRGCSPYDPAELESYRALLEGHQSESLKDLTGLSDSTQNTVGEAVGGGSSVPGHLAELASETFEQELSIEFMGRTSEELKEIQAALERIDNRSYGLCEECERAIPPMRLEAMPTARFCIQCKSRQEQQ